MSRLLKLLEDYWWVWWAAVYITIGTFLVSCTAPTRVIIPRPSAVRVIVNRPANATGEEYEAPGQVSLHDGSGWRVLGTAPVTMGVVQDGNGALTVTGVWSTGGTR